MLLTYLVVETMTGTEPDVSTYYAHRSQLVSAPSTGWHTDARQYQGSLLDLPATSTIVGLSNRVTAKTIPIQYNICYHLANLVGVV